MTVLMVLAIFVTFLVIDAVYSKKRHIAPILHPAARQESAAAPRLTPTYVSGFEVAANVGYHPGHTWAICETPALVRVGMDDFAGKLIHKIDSIHLPQRGQWVRQGQRLATLERDGARVDLISPIEGSVGDINEAVANNPELAMKDPYGEGWLVTVSAPDAKTNFRNLLRGSVARSWMQEAAERLMKRSPAYAGALAQDGGVAVADLAAEMDVTELAKEFLLN